MKKALEVLKKVAAFAEWTILVVLAVLLFYVFFNTLQGKAVKIFGYNVLYVVTGSMEPTISTNEYIFVRDAEVSLLEKEDIIAYYSEESDVSGMIVIHRIVDVLSDGSFITKGDANETSDARPVRGDQVIGKYCGRVGPLNFISSFMDFRKILMLLVIIPMFLASIYEVSTIRKLTKKMREEKMTKEEKAKAQESYDEMVERLKKEAVEEYLKSQPDDGSEDEVKPDDETKDIVKTDETKTE